MSNQLVGEVYQRIIQDVIDTSVIDFEEAGVNASTLEELKQVWQQRLSDLHVAHFPWDPAPPETVAPTPAQPAPTSPTKAQPQQPGIKQEANAQNSAGIMGQNAGGVRIKPEPGLEPQGVYVPPVTPGNPTHNPALAEQRARQNIAQKLNMNPQVRPNGGGLVLPGLSQQRQQNGQNGIPQHDGADDVVPIEGYGNISRDEADRILLCRIGAAERESAKATEELTNALKGLKTTSSSKSSKKRRPRRQDAYEAALDGTNSYPYPSTQLSSHTPRPVGISQLDGDSDEDIADEDAINSDLDDPEDDEIDNEDEDEVPQIMLCMYDKVQRTKNKWKCVLKDGVLTINGKEYVFHKANGEYEW
ncbi:transcription factor IIA, alpha/beta subunit [Morchella snyderi]|nr:transcription factor IIA, alpha/beta subunit [Morchella snyderi]